MAVATIVQTKYAVFIDSVQVRTSTEVLINESLDNLCRVAEFELSEQPVAEPAVGDPILIQFLDYDAEISYDAFGGTIAAIEIESEPWSMVIRCTDQLELLRRVPANDHILTTMTDGEGVMEVLDSCNVTYDPLDIEDTGYVLGAEIGIRWLEGVTGAQMVNEINQIFGMALMTVGNDRVIRFRVDKPPVNSTGKYRDYEKGVDADWNAHRRSHGDRDQIQNLWFVRGASWPCGTDDACTCQPWAKAISGNAQLGGRRIRTTTQTISSDIIQDEALAEYVVRQQMRMTNRLAENATVETVNDVNVHPGTKIGLIDHTYGINTEAVRLATVISVDRTGYGMTLSCVCGAPGAEGTVTHGVEKVCNDTHADIDIPGSFTPPAFDFPPFDSGLSFDPLDFFLFSPPIQVIGGTTDPGGGGIPQLGDWVADSFGANHNFGNGSDHVTEEGAAHNTTFSRGLGDAWTLTATISPSTTNTTALMMGADGLSFEYNATIYSTSDGGGCEVTSLNGDDFDATDLSGELTVVVELDYDGIDTLTGTFTGSGAPVIIVHTTDDISFPPAVPLYPGVRVYTNPSGGSADFDDMVIA